MQPWSQADARLLSGVESLPTDVDNTLTSNGRLESATMLALE